MVLTLVSGAKEIPEHPDDRGTGDTAEQERTDHSQ